MTWPQLKQQVASLALHLQAQGVQPGDRIAAYLPNIPEAMVAFLATVSIGGVWSICAPDMGTNAVLDRFKQIEPKVLIACDGVTFGGKDHDRLAVVAELCAALPSVQHVILQDNLGTLQPFIEASKNTINIIATKAYYTQATAKMMPFQSLLNHFGSHLATHCGLSIPAARRGCPNRLFTATAVSLSSRWPVKCCTTTWAAVTRPTTWANASTGTALPAG
jgi:non-ribosomal peptide synthetase component F